MRPAGQALTDNSDPMILNTLAQIHFDLGHLQQAVEWQRRILDHLDKAPTEGSKRFFRSTLEKYEAALKAKTGE